MDNRHTHKSHFLKIPTVNNLTGTKMNYVAIFIISIAAPLLIGIFISIPGFSWLSANNDWIGFWGSYAGAIIGGIITLLVMKNTLYVNRLMQEKQRKQETINHIAALVSSFCIEMMSYRSKWNTLYKKCGGKEIDSMLKIEIGATTEEARKIYFEIDILAGDIVEAQQLLLEIKKVLDSNITSKSVRDTEIIMSHLRDEAKVFSKKYLPV